MSILIETPPVDISPIAEDETLAKQALPIVANLCDHPLPELNEEDSLTRKIWLGAAAVIVLLYAIMTFHFWSPADGGVDQNAYLLGGRMIAEHLTPRYTLSNPYQYVGGMLVRTTPLTINNVIVKGGDYYPKYPFGLPLIYATYFWVFGKHAATLAFLTSPISAVIAVAGMFYLARQICGSLAGALAAILLGTSQLMLSLSNNPNSHATCVGFIIWGMFFLIRWWQSGGMWRGVLAGFLIGFAALVRYSEGLLVLPIAVACASRLRWSDWKSYFRCALPGLAWAVPVGTLLLFNHHTMGNWTGYDSTNESEGFTWVKFTQTWEQMIRTYYDMGAFFVLPLGLAGIAIIANRSWKLSIMLALWLLPGTALYTAYYWSPDRGVSYARFILTFIPVIMLGTVICFNDAMLAVVKNSAWYRKLPRLIAVAIVMIASSALGIYRAAHGLQQGQAGNGMMSLEEEHRQRENLAQIGRKLLANIPVDSTVIADSTGAGGGNEKALNYIQFLRKWDIYESTAFEVGGGQRGGGGRANFGNGFGLIANAAAPDPNAAPTTRQKLQLDYIEALYKGKTSSDLEHDEAAMFESAFKNHHAVFALVLQTRDSSFRQNLKSVGRYNVHQVDAWTDYPPLPMDPVADNINNNGNHRNRARPTNNAPQKNGPPNNAGRRGGGFGNGGGDGGGGDGGGGFGSSEAAPVTWELLEIKPDTSPLPVRPVRRTSNQR